MATWREIRENLFLAFGNGSLLRFHKRQKNAAINLTLNADMEPATVHVFASSLPTKEALLQYCYSPVTPHGPEQINLDLPDAALDTSLIEIAHGEDEIRDLLREYFAPRQVGRLLAEIGAAPGCVLMPREAFELTNSVVYKNKTAFLFNREDFETVGTVLHDTGHLRYVGATSRPWK